MSFLDVIFGPLLNLPPILGIACISLFVAVLMSLIYKYTTNQDLMKDLKTELKELQKQMKELRAHPEKMMKVQSKSMEVNMKYMTHSMKPMIFTMIPVVLIFGWLMANFSYVGLVADQDFSATVYFQQEATGNITVIADNLELLTPATQDANTKVVFSFAGTKNGTYPIKFIYGPEEYVLDVIIGDGKEFSTPVVGNQRKVLGLIPVGPKANTLDSHSMISSINIDLEKLRPFGAFSFFGWKPAALGTYIIFSILFSSIVRKILRVY